ncbi:4191_t:CDS:2 [Cetraspora pellucida]|uniref:Cilia- and flagella-associated protein 300 n=1 Tax=Cetraspora pellucida TaxID=1433469 RepID=A0A9N8ZUI9_9GLOM|nr:4191_t:CDS:2 [Cetraspora pellucida]
MSEVSSSIEHSNPIVSSEECSSNTSEAVNRATSPEQEPVFRFKYHCASIIDDILRQTGAIVKSFPIYINSFPITDKLRQIFLLPKSSNYTLFNDDDRNEFIFHVLQSICLGGDICQFEDEIDNVQRNTSTGNLMVQSYVYKINNLQGTLLSSSLFPISESNDENTDDIPSNNFCYVTVDPVKRWVNVWYHAACEYFC